MIKILVGSRAFICNCKKCGCVFEYEATDIIKNKTEEYSIICPLCSTENIHTLDNIKSDPEIYTYTNPCVPGLPTTSTAPDGCDLKITYETFCDNIEGY